MIPREPIRIRIPNDYETVETVHRVPGIGAALTTSFRRRAVRRARKLNAARVFESYRWEVVPRRGGRYSVEPFQNEARRRK